ncbi:endonuclease/exonuclease/phosphatase family protein [Cellulophaga sp. F20128]|uniref:endonuclease/exonuclease/phosphatase family protein n=1 Tax=Cellulophaga sp. F20128 TaxID=2926413 RepID=UPI001FF54017|nr:endonuclease/exonuclease/phosphatase family protein [Cellulophaga sp. F20128]MCK0158272.1 endonuclease/exonuclease/phosphatase family protein [Cellulophaga sp. F20128]
MESVNLINEKINDLDTDIPVIVTGDFNFTEDSEVYTEITSNGLSNSKKASIEEPYGPEGTFNGFQIDQIAHHRIDFIFVNQRIKVL